MDEKITQMLIEEAAEARKQSFSPGRSGDTVWRMGAKNHENV